MPIVDLETDVTATWTTPVDGPAVLTVTQPDGTAQVPDVTTASGTFTATVTTPYAGRYLLRWVAPAATYTDIINVWEEDPRFLIALGDARKAIGTAPSDDNELRLFVAAATPVIESIVGAVLTRTETQPADGGKTGVALWERPDEVLGVTVNGELLEPTEYTVAKAPAIVYAGGSTTPTRFPVGRQNIVVTYTTGFSTIPPNIRLAAIELVRHLWQVGRQGSRPAFGDDPSDEPTDQTPMGFAVPRRVTQLCGANPSLPGTA